jgi:hypothetical protein
VQSTAPVFVKLLGEAVPTAEHGSEVGSPGHSNLSREVVEVFKPAKLSGVSPSVHAANVTEGSNVKVVTYPPRLGEQ